jgi:Acetyltransferase (isoleucine patch superfamily)
MYEKLPLYEDYEKKIIYYLYEIIKEKNNGKIIIGCGFPFFFDKYQKLAELCQYFVTSKHSSFYYQSICNTISIDSLIDEFDLRNIFLVVFSYTDYFCLKRLGSVGLHEESVLFLEVDDFYTEVVVDYEQIYNSKEIKIFGNTKECFRFRNACKFAGENQIKVVAKNALEVGYLAMRNSTMIYKSKGNNCINNLYIHGGSYIEFYENTEVLIDNMCLGDYARVSIYNGKFKAGHAYIGANATIQVYNQLTIGNNCLISWNVNILDGDGHNLMYENKKNYAKAIIIEDNVWIGNNVTVLKGVHIGAGSIIGAGSVVTSSIPNRCLAVGNPARIIKTDVSWENIYINF